jgi:hypothetical protein
MTIKGSCHCGATQFTVAQRPAAVTRCTCSFCSKLGALWAYQDAEEDFVLTTARDRVSTYQWGVIRSSITTAPYAAGHVVPFAPLVSECLAAGGLRSRCPAAEVIDGKRLW